MKTSIRKPLVILISLVLGLVSCQMEEETILKELVQQQKSPPPEEIEDTASSGSPVPQSPAIQTPPLEGKDESTEVKPPKPQTPSAEQNPDIILGVTQVRVQFDPDTGKLYHPDGSVSSNPINTLLTTGYTVSRPQATPYKEGCNFKGWVQQYPDADLLFDQAKPWDFDNTLLTEGMTLYAYFEKSDSPDPKPQIVVQPSTPSYIDNSRVYSLNIDDVPVVTSLEKTPDSDGLYTFFATDVTKDSGWFNSPQYMGHCWATSSSQMIYWYQGQLKKLGKTPAAGQPETIQELRDWFADGHALSSGWHIEWALEKYFQIFYPDSLSAITTYRRDGYYFSLQTLSDILLKHLSRGDMCGLTAVNFDGGLHAMNIYGARFNAQGIVEVLYVTSSPTLDEEGIKKHKPKLYEFKYHGSSNQGAPEWLATYEVRGDGYTSTSQSSIRNIYGLDFLTVSRHQ